MGRVYSLPVELLCSCVADFKIGTSVHKLLVKFNVGGQYVFVIFNRFIEKISLFR